MRRLWVLIAALIAAASGARADVLASRFDPRGKDAVAAIHKRVPDCYWRVGEDVKLSSCTRGTMTLLTFNPNVIGLYRDLGPTIQIVDKQTEYSGQFDDTAVHEYGHFVWFRLLTTDERHEYTTLWELLKAIDSLPSDYAETNVAEGFAETFRAVYSDKRGTTLERLFLRRVFRRLWPLRELHARPHEADGAAPWPQLWEIRRRP